MVFGGKTMPEKKLVALGLICVILSVGVIGAVMMLDQKDSDLQTKTEQISGLENEKLTLETQVSALQSEKANLKTEVSSLQFEATSLNNEKAALETELSNMQNETTVLENENSILETEVSTLQANISSMQLEVVSLEDDKVSLEMQVSTLQTDVADLENEAALSYDLGYDVGKTDGYQLGYDEGYLQGVENLTEDCYYTRDPTYAEAVAFINSDKTDQNRYSEDYVCYDFTADFNANAFQAGYRCGFVYIEFSDSAHAIACFNTTDMGLIFVETQNDEIVTLTVGQTYLNYTITDLGIIW
jgi:hypothetical protein